MTQLSNVCRTCMIKNDCPISIFDTEMSSCKSVKLSEMLLECASVQITANDKLPKTICQKCAEQIKSSYEFRIICHESERKLLKLIEDSFISNIKKLCNEPSLVEPEIIIKTDPEQNANNEELSTESGKSFVCNICDKTFVKKSKLRIHMDRHLGVKRFTCKICDKGSVEKYDLVKHINKVHEIIRGNISEYIVVAKPDVNIESEIIVRDETMVKTETDIKNETEQSDTLIDNDEFYFDENELDTTVDSDNLCQTEIQEQNNADNGFLCATCNQTFKEQKKYDLHLKCHEIMKFNCDFCRKMFAKKCFLERHIKQMHANKQLKDSTDNLCESQTIQEQTDFHCTTCNKSFKEQKKYDLHLKCHEVMKFNCDFCRKIFVKKCFLERHLKQMHANKQLKDALNEDDKTCKICKKIFSGKYKLDIHMNRHMGIKRFKCTKCDKCFVEKNDLMKHIYKVHSFSDLSNEANKNACSPESPVSNTEETNEDSAVDNSFIKYPLKCDLCLQLFWKKSSYDLHLKRHLGIRKFKCDICLRTFVTHYDLKRHLRTHGELTGFHCKQCYKSFDKSEDLEAHMAEHADDSPLVCKECGKQFMMKGNLKLHMAVHSGVRPHLCTVCGRAFTLSSNLKVHMRIHSGEKPYNCKVCNKAFTQWASLRSHMAVHAEEKRFVCQTCGKAFRGQNTLRVHLRCHNGIRKIPCPLCDKRFYDKALLRKHFVTHTDEKKFKCETCGKAFNRADHLRVHSRTHRGERLYACEVCSKSFTQNQCLINHMKTHTDQVVHS